MKNKKILMVVLAAVVVAGIIAGIAIFGSSQPTYQKFSAEEIALSEVPAPIRKDLELVLEERGTHSFQEKNSDTKYVLLSAGNVMGKTLAIEPTDIKDGVYFSVKLLDSEERTETLQYKIYRTQAPSVTADDYLLQNPYIKVGATGSNIGYLRAMTQGYYVLPFEDTDGLNRIYSASEEKNVLEDGIYSFSYQLTEDGVTLLSASPVKSQVLFCTVDSFTDGVSPSVSVSYGKHGLNMELAVTDDGVLETLRENDFSQTLMIARCTVKYTKQLVLSELEPLSSASVAK